LAGSNFHIFQSYSKSIHEIAMVVASRTYAHHIPLNEMSDRHALAILVENHRAIEIDAPY
jgi:hypothetical protein